MATSPKAGPRLFMQDATAENAVVISSPAANKTKDMNKYEITYKIKKFHTFGAISSDNGELFMRENLAD